MTHVEIEFETGGSVQMIEHKSSKSVPDAIDDAIQLVPGRGEIVSVTATR